MLNDAVIKSSSSFDPTLYHIFNYVILADIVRGEDDLIAAGNSESSSALTARTLTDLFFRRICSIHISSLLCDPCSTKL